MSTAIIWVLLIVQPSAYCMSYPSISFETEAECKTALAGLDKQHAQFASCEPKAYKKE
jgi:hypothetical protein